MARSILFCGISRVCVVFPDGSLFGVFASFFECMFLLMCRYWGGVPFRTFLLGRLCVANDRPFFFVAGKSFPNNKCVLARECPI